ncbi:MAG: GLUG motif-containing protein, partial [Bacteroidota bacterium]
MKFLKRIPGIVVMSFLAFFEAAAQFSGGSGTLADPYQISTVNDLVTLSANNTYVGNHFIQTADIDASSTNTLNSGAGFRGIGSPSSRFTGTYNGNNKTITGLFINRPTTASMGLFRSTSGATIKDLNLVNVNITANDNTAAVVGWALGSSVIENVKVTGTSTITANATDCGGIAGEAENSTLTGCYVSATIAGVNNTGGLIGFCCTSGTSTTISRCYTNGSISSTGSNVGGLIGTNEQTVVNSYSTASVTSGTNIGGLAGSNTGTITNCYSKGALTGSTPVGGFVGTNTGSVTNCFWDTQTSGAPLSAAGEGKTTEFMQSPCTYEETGWDFDGETDNGTD